MIVIDATPLQTVHRHHGIGSYTAGLLSALTQVAVSESQAEQLGLLLQMSQPDDLLLAAELRARPGVHIIPVQRPRWRLGQHQWVVDRLSWLVRPRIIKAALQRTWARVYHATEPHGVVTVPGARTVATLYDLIPLHYPDAFFPWRWLDLRATYARYLHELQRTDHLIAISMATKQDAVDRLRIPPERISVIPLAVDETRFYPRSVEEIATALGRHSLRRPYFLHLGSSFRHKNLAAIVHAFSLFSHEDSSECALYAIGSWEPGQIADLETAYRQLFTGGHLRFLSYVPDDDLPALYSGAHALVYPSLIEGFGLPVLEAMACGTPVVTSNTSSLPEVGGDAALYVDPHNVDEIAAALQRLADEPALRTDLVARGLRRAHGFSWRRTAEQTLRVYRELLS